MQHQIKILVLLALVLTGLLVFLILKEPATLSTPSIQNAQTHSAEPTAQTSPSTPNSQPETPPAPADSLSILFFGDSMLETLGKRAADYALQNGHTLNSVVWYSSTSELWAQTDTLQYFLQKFQPDFVMICLCGNELFVKDLDNRSQYISTIIHKLGDIPFVWISPPNWKDDTGITSLIQQHVGKNRYFDSTHYRKRMERKRDGAHPTQRAANWWMDSIADWLNSPLTAYPVRMERPDTTNSRYNFTILQPVR